MDLEMLDVVRCPECGGYFAECSVDFDTMPNIVQHCVDVHPKSLIARTVALAEEEGVVKV